MADRFPLILNTSTNQIQEIPNGDQLDLSGNNLANAGIITATTFSGNLTGNVTGNINGNLTGTLQTAAQPNITSLGTLSSLNVSGNASIGGVLTYEDVTSVDSIGIITARAGVHCSTDGVGNGIKVGAGSDLIIQHNGTNSFIDNNTGDLYIQTTGSGDDILIESADDFTVKVNGSETAIQATGDGAVNLYFDNSKKLETTSSGAKITGTATATGSLIVGSGNNLQFTRSGGNTEIQNYSGTLLFSNASSNSNNVFIRGRSDENSIICIPNGAVELYFDNSKKFESTSTGITVSGSNTTGSRINGSLVLATDGGSSNIEHIGVNGTLRFYDNKKASFGTGDDLQIYHDGNNSFIRDEGTGNLYIDSDDGNIFLRVNSNEQGVTVVENGAVELYYNNVKKLATTANGIKLNDNTRIGLGDGEDLQIYHNGTHSYIQESGAGALQIRGANLILDNADGSKRYIDCNDGGSVELYYDNSQKMLTSSTGINVNFRIAASGDENTYVNLGNPADQWQFYTGGVDRLFITGGPSDDGTVQIRGDNNKLQIGASQDLQLFHDGSHSRLYSATGMFNIQSDDFRVTDAANSLTAFKIDPDGATDLRYNGSVKLQTTNDGVTVIGDLFFDNPSNADADLKFVASDSKLKFNDNVKANFGSGNDLQVYHNGSHSVISNATGTLFTLADNLSFKNNANNETLITAAANGAVELYYDNSIKLKTVSDGVSMTNGFLQIYENDSTKDKSQVLKLSSYANATNEGPFIDFNTVWNGGNYPNWYVARIGGIYETETGGSNQGALVFHTADTNNSAQGLSVVTEKMRLTGAGHLRPSTNSAHDLGTSSYRWRNIYTSDLNLSNEGSKNDVDGTWGSYTIQEGEDELFLINKRSGKKYKFNLTEVS